MNSTLEVRWFLPGKLPPTLYDRLVAALSAPIDSETREDWYLYSPQTHDLGIKLRAGNLEIKQRQQSNEASWTSNLQGHLEQWIKWSFPIHASDHENPHSSTNLIFSNQFQSWLNVHKTRWSWHYQIRAGAIALVETIDSVSQGCSFELSELQINTQFWHSLCFEASGPTDTLIETLNCTVEQLAQSNGLPHLTQQHSYGYPAWLQEVRQNAP